LGRREAGGGRSLDGAVGCREGMTPCCPGERSCPLPALVPRGDGREPDVPPVAVDRNFGQVFAGPAV